MAIKRIFSVFLMHVLVTMSFTYLLFEQKARGATYLITPTDDLNAYVYPTMESLQPSDIVEFAPGKYEYRICFNQQSGSVA